MGPFAEPSVIKEGNTLRVVHGSDRECYVEFRKHPVYHQVESEQHGRQIWHDVDYITIMFPGDKTKKVDRPVEERDKQRFSEQWRQFLETGVVAQVGTPLEEWGPITKSQAMELKSLSIHTVEQLAGVGDSLLGFLGAREYREQARKWLEKVDGDKGRMDALMNQHQELATKHDELEQRHSELMAQHAALIERLSAAPAAPKPAGKKRGPKPKATQTEPAPL